MDRESIVAVPWRAVQDAFIKSIHTWDLGSMDRFCLQYTWIRTNSWRSLYTKILARLWSELTPVIERFYCRTKLFVLSAVGLNCMLSQTIVADGTMHFSYWNPCASRLLCTVRFLARRSYTTTRAVGMYDLYKYAVRNDCRRNDLHARQDNCSLPDLHYKFKLYSEQTLI